MWSIVPCPTEGRRSASSAWAPPSSAPGRRASSSTPSAPPARAASTALTCPAGLDIALINKYHDLVGLGDRLAREHYLTLEKTASDCLARGHRDRRCPFHVPQSQRMETIRAFFGK